MMMSGREAGLQLSLIQFTASSIAVHSSSKELVYGAPLDMTVSEIGGSSWCILMTAAAPPCRQPSTAEPSVKMVRFESHFSMAAIAALRILAWSSFLLLIPSRSEKIDTLLIVLQGGFSYWAIAVLCSASGGMNSESSLASLAQLLLLFREGIADERAMALGWFSGFL